MALGAGTELDGKMALRVGAYEYEWGLSDGVGARAMRLKLSSVTGVSVPEYDCPTVIIDTIRDERLTLEYVTGRHPSRSVWLPETAFVAFRKACLEVAAHLEAADVSPCRVSRYVADGDERGGYLIECDRTLGLLLVRYNWKVSDVPDGPEPGNVVDKEYYYPLRLAVSAKDLNILRAVLELVPVLYSSERNSGKMIELERRMKTLGKRERERVGESGV